MNRRKSVFKSRPAMIAYSLIALGTTVFFDLRTPIDLLLIYFIILIAVADRIGGWYPYIFAVMTAYARVLITYQMYSITAVPTSYISMSICAMMIVHLIVTKNKLLQRLEDSALTDPLTCIPNRRAFNNALKLRVADVQRYKEAISVAYIDVDGFKAVNDTQGHQRGDQLLQCISHVIDKTIREPDIGARLGGDEFAIIFTHTSSSVGLIKRLQHELDECVKQQGFPVSFSIGVISYRGLTEISAEDILRRADELMYEVKKSSKNGVRYENMDNQ